ncbi:MAG TPA: energy transducer TonB [Pyrinomonadaceae bacterium]|nr:energy transducer TonB [Pyrinomonadaceae bacterium]
MRHQLFRASLVLAIVLIGVPAVFAQSGAAKTPPPDPPSLQAPQNGGGTGADPKAPPLDGNGTPIYPGKEVDQKVRVTKKPTPKYTKEARKNAITGTVVLRCVFDATGHVRNVHVITGLPYGLTDSAIQAADKIQFTPAVKDGRPVSMWMELQYNFH